MDAEVVVTSPGNQTARASFVYDQDKTAVVTGVSPRRGGTGGGTRVTITGTNFGQFVVV